MGCWDETCGITRQPIHADQPCVMVVLHSSLSELLTSHPDFFIRRTKAIYKGTYNDYGWIEEKTEEDSEEYGQDQAIFFHKDAWDRVVEYQKTATRYSKPLVDYMEKTLKRTFADETMLDLIRLKTKIESAMAEREDIPYEKEELSEDASFEEYVEAFPEHIKVPKFISQFLSVCLFAHSIRRDLAGVLEFKGCQDNRDFDLKEFSLKLDRDTVKKTKKRFEE
jgi:hypothetical protein